nr:DNA mismatch repair protein MSH2 [Seculamonas ecuadoriensis]
MAETSGIQHQLNLTAKVAQSFTQFFKSLPKNESIVRFFDRKQGEYYTVHADDALRIAQDYFNTTVGIKPIGPVADCLTGLTVSARMFREVVPDLLLRRGVCVEVYAQRGIGETWECVQKGTPGNLDAFEDLVLGNAVGYESGVVAAVRMASVNSERIVGVGFVDTTNRVLGLSEFVENEQYSNLESLLLQVGVRECIVLFDAAVMDVKKVRDVMTRCEIATFEKKRTDFANDDTERDVGRLVEDVVQHTSDFELKHAAGALSAAIKHLDLLRDESNYGQFTLRRVNLHDYVQLDAAAVRALNLFPAPSDSHKSMSLFGLLNRCKTQMGARRLAQWIRQPLVNADAINERLDLVDLFVQDPVLRQTLRDEHLKRIPDIQRVLRKLQRGRASLEDAVRVYQVALRLPLLVSSLEEAEAARGFTIGSNESPLWQRFGAPLRESSDNFVKLIELIESVLDLEQAQDHVYMVKPEFDDELMVLKEAKDEIESEMGQAYQDVLRSLGLKDADVKLDNNTKLGYHFRVLKKHEKLIRNRPDFTSETTKSEVRFLNAKMRQLNARHNDAAAKYNEQQQGLVDKTLSIVATYVPVMDSVVSVLSDLDVLLSFAESTVSAPVAYVRPTIAPIHSGFIELHDARHPCLEVQEGVTFIPNDAVLKRGESNFVIVSGPNMGGKSTYIRSIGVVVLMAQIGCFVPCSSANISCVDSVSARVGASDSQLRGISTFMSEMLETSTILHSATPDSLIIIDELGRGTSTYDGYGLAYSISEHIARDIGCFCMFATHFHELTSLEGQAPGVVNTHVTAHTRDNKLTMLYKVRPGSCDQSFGIHVAELAGFPASVIKMARRKAAELEDFQHNAHDDDADNGAPQLKRQKLDPEGEREINDMINEFVELPLERMTPGDAQSALQSLYEKYSSSTNPAVRAFVLEATTADDANAVEA